MKVDLAAPFVGLLLVVSMTLHGCELHTHSPEKTPEKPVKIAAPRPPWMPSKEETASRCAGGTLSVEEAKLCKGPCTPQCTWECQSRKCNQVCAPKCNQPLCSTRCKAFNTDDCEMKCGKPSCQVVCPKDSCPEQNCAACKTECDEPVCKMECPKGKQKCRNICAQPVCKYECTAPKECPKPKCNMKCQKPRNCLDDTHMVQQLPALDAGETEVMSFQTPKSLLLATAGKVSTLRVNITSMGPDRSLQSGQVDLPYAMMEAVASTLSQSAFLQQRSRVQGHLQP